MRTIVTLSCCGDRYGLCYFSLPLSPPLIAQHYGHGHPVCDPTDTFTALLALTNIAAAIVCVLAV